MSVAAVPFPSQLPGGYSWFEDEPKFDAAKHLRVRMEKLERLPERGMGLLMLNAATDSFEYSRSTSGLHRLEFSVSADVDPWLNIPF